MDKALKSKVVSMETLKKNKINPIIGECLENENRYYLN